MTRFARAKGSKASNERVPETSTPWNIMKEDLQKSQEEAKNKKNREKIYEERQKNYIQFVKETESKKEKQWAAFPKKNRITIKKGKNEQEIKNKRQYGKNIEKIKKKYIQFVKETESKSEEQCAAFPKQNLITIKKDKNKDGIENKKHRKKIEKLQKNYIQFVKETESETEKQCAAFPKQNLITIKKDKNKGGIKKNIEMLISEDDVTEEMIQEMCHSDPEVDEQLMNITQKIEQVLSEEFKEDDDEAPEEATPKVAPKTLKIKKAKNKKQALKMTEDMIQEMRYSDPEVDEQLMNMTPKIEQVLSEEFKEDDDEAPEEATTKVAPKALKIKKAKNKKQALKMTEGMIQEMRHSDPEVDEQLMNMTQKIDQVLSEEPKEDDDEAPEEATTKVAPKAPKIKKAKNKKQALKIAQQQIQTPEKKQMQEKKHMQGEKESPDKKQLPGKKQKQKNEGEKQKGDRKIDKNTKFNNNENQNQKRKLPTEGNDQEHKRRKPFTEDYSITINGERQAIIRYQGFPVLQSDHDRLAQLRRDLVSKGIPRSEVNKTMKLERRKAEKVLSRFKKHVCFQCREIGHVLSECPELGNANSLVENNGTGICFKCGSTEHNYKTCRVSNDFKFAKCFICREQGHISGQCPDNPNGLYPKGGACKMCGDVTHLKKNCPKYVEKQQNNAIFLNTISDGNIESIEDTVKPDKKKDTLKKKKVITF